MRSAKLYITFVAVTLVLASCEDSNRMSTDIIVVPATASKKYDNDVVQPEITFAEDSLNFGVIAAGKIISHSFEFTNTGNGPLLLTNVHTPCGCTAATNWPKEEISPGEGGVIEVEFNSTDRQGHQMKTIDIISNSRPSISQVKLVGDVVGPDFTLEDIK